MHTKNSVDSPDWAEFKSVPIHHCMNSKSVKKPQVGFLGSMTWCKKKTKKKLDGRQYQSSVGRSNNPEGHASTMVGAAEQKKSDKNVWTMNKPTDGQTKLWLIDSTWVKTRFAGGQEQWRSRPFRHLGWAGKAKTQRSMYIVNRPTDQPTDGNYSITLMQHGLY